MFYQILNSFLKQTDPEVAHEYAIKFLKQKILNNEQNYNQTYFRSNGNKY